MRNLLVVISLLCSAVVYAQENPKYELFGGYSLQHNDGFNDGFNASGWEASGAYNFNRWIGMKLDVDLKYLEAKGAEHNDKAFSQRAGQVLEFLFPVSTGIAQ